jgi:hypothetical protein
MRKLAILSLTLWLVLVGSLAYWLLKDLPNLNAPVTSDVDGWGVVAILGSLVVVVLLICLRKPKPSQPQYSPTEEEIQEEEDAILATQAMMALGGMMMSDQPPFHHLE